MVGSHAIGYKESDASEKIGAFHDHKVISTKRSFRSIITVESWEWK